MPRLHDAEVPSLNITRDRGLGVVLMPSLLAQVLRRNCSIWYAAFRRSRIIRRYTARQGRGYIQTRHANPIVRHAIIDVEAIGLAKIVATIDARRKYDIVNRTVALERAFRN